MFEYQHELRDGICNKVEHTWKPRRAFDSPNAREAKYFEGLTYVGDLVAKIDKSTSFNSNLTMQSWAVINAIPPRWGLEDWVRPE